jgi:hypothetical protein
MGDPDPQMLETLVLLRKHRGLRRVPNKLGSRARFFLVPERAQGVTESIMGFCKIRPNVDGRA